MGARGQLEGTEQHGEAARGMNEESLNRPACLLSLYKRETLHSKLSRNKSGSQLPLQFLTSP